MGMLKLAFDIRAVESEPARATSHYPTIQVSVNNADEGNAVISSPDVLWSKPVGGDYVSVVTAIDDVDGDGKQDVVAGTIYNFKVWCSSGATGNPIWSQVVEGWVMCIAIIEDVNNDEKQDVVVGTDYPDPGVKCLSGETGALLWSYSTLSTISCHMYGVYSVCPINDVSGDGKPDVVAGTEMLTTRRGVLCLNGADGSLIWSFEFDGIMVCSVINIGDVDKDAKDDIVAISNLVDGQFGVFCISGCSGTLIWQLTGPGSVDWHRSDRIGDIDGDQTSEVVVCINGTNILCLNGQMGDVLWAYSVPEVYYIVLREIGDVNNDNKHDILVGGQNKTMCISGAGELLWSYEASGFIESLGSIDDVNNDGKPEAVIGTAGYYETYLENKTVCISGCDGSLIWSYAVRDAVGCVTGIDDVNGDGKQEVVIGTWERDGQVHVISGGSVGAGVLIWSYQCGSMAWRLIPINDVNDDGKRDLVVYSFEGKTRCLSGSSGQVLWTIESDGMPYVVADVNNDMKQDIIIGDKCYSGNNGALIWSSSLLTGGLIANVQDIDGDGALDILGYSSVFQNYDWPFWIGSYNVSCVTGATGVQIWSYTVNFTYTYYPPSPPRACIADINSDGISDVVVASLWASWSDPFGVTHDEVHAIDGNSIGSGDLLWKYEVPSPINSLLTVDDVNDDDAQDVVVATLGGMLYCLSGSGSLIWSSPSKSVPLTQISDVNDDNKPDVIATTSIPYNKTMCFSGRDGTLLWSYTTSSTTRAHAWGDLYKTYTLDDINGDGKKEVLIETVYPDDSLYCINGREGTLLWSTKLGRGIRYFDPINDLNGDGKREILVGATNRTGYCVSSKDGSIIWKFVGKSYVTCMWQTDDFDEDGRQDFFAASGEVYCLSYQPPPVRAIKELIEVIETWNLPKGTENSLTSELRVALHHLDRENENGALNKLTLFIKRVEAMRNKKLTDEKANYLIAEARRIIDLIEA